MRFKNGSTNNDKNEEELRNRDERHSAVKYYLTLTLQHAKPAVVAQRGNGPHTGCLRSKERLAVGYRATTRAIRNTHTHGPPPHTNSTRDSADTHLAILADELGAVTGEDLQLGEVANISFDDHSCSI
jgi:hypothetical protein